MILLPYQRYMAVLPEIEKEKREEAARIEAENKKRQLCPAAPAMMPVDIKDVKKENAEEDIYSIPIRAMLKRKYEESVAKKAATVSAADGPSNSKRIKVEKTTNETNSVTPTDDKLKFVNLPPTKKELEQQKQQLKRKSDISTTALTNDDDGDSEDDEQPEEKPSVSQSQENEHKQQGSQQSTSKKKFKNKNKKQKFNASNKSHQSSDKPIQTNFDYQKVDFKKFQGGAQKAKGTEIKAQFHPKVSYLNSKTFLTIYAPIL